MKLSAASVIVINALAATAAPILVDRAVVPQSKLEVPSASASSALTMHARPAAPAVRAAVIESAHSADSDTHELSKRVELTAEGEKLLGIIKDFNAQFDMKGGKKNEIRRLDVNFHPEWIPEHPKLQEAMDELQSRLPKARKNKSMVKALKGIHPELGDRYPELRESIRIVQHQDQYQRTKSHMLPRAKAYYHETRKSMLATGASHEVPTTPVELLPIVDILLRLRQRKNVKATSLEMDAARALLGSKDVPKRSDGQIKVSAASQELRNAYRIAKVMLNNKATLLLRQNRSKAAKLGTASFMGSRESTSTAALDVAASGETVPVTSTSSASVPSLQLPNPELRNPEMREARSQHSQQPTLKNYPLLDLNSSPDRSMPSPDHN